jgi:HlyD family secretion protein
MRIRRWNKGIVWVGGLMTLAAIGWGISSRPVPILSRWSPASPWADLPRVVVRRTDLQVSLLTGGRVESSVKTLIECELENLTSKNGGPAAAAGGSSTILELVPDGSRVGKGDVLCRLDASEYQEMARQQEIQVQQARADWNRAELDFQTAELALQEYQDGVRVQLRQDYEGKIALAQADRRRQEDRVAWARRMVPLGYIAPSKLEAEKHLLLQAELTLARLGREFASYRRFVEPNTLRTLSSRVEAANAVLAYQTNRRAQQERRLASLRRQVELCTIRAPHDGVVIYANQQDDNVRIMTGIRVRQKQDLFYLPDLSRMEVQALLHETVVQRVQPSMPTQIRIEALADRLLMGRVVSISPLPVPTRRRSGSDIKNYQARVVLEEVPAELRPGMSAAVEILTAQRPGALVIPRDAVARAGGRDVCYVAGPRGLERRRVAIGPASHDLLEVTAGLAEGEEVVLVPARAEVAAVLDAASIPGEDVVFETSGTGDGIDGRSSGMDSSPGPAVAEERNTPAPGLQAGE